MGLIDFMKEAGEKLFGHGQAQAAMTEVKADPGNADKMAAAEKMNSKNNSVRTKQSNK